MSDEFDDLFWPEESECESVGSCENCDADYFDFEDNGSGLCGECQESFRLARKSQEQSP